MERLIGRLKEFSAWFDVQANEKANDLLTERHTAQLDSIINDIELAHFENMEQLKQAENSKEEVKAGLTLLANIGEAIEKISLVEATLNLGDIALQLERMNDYQAMRDMELPRQSLWEKIKKWLKIS